MKPVLILSDSFRNASIIFRQQGVRQFNRSKGTGILADGQKFKIVAPCDDPRTVERLRGTAFGSMRFVPLSAEKRVDPYVLAQARSQIRPNMKGYYRGT